MQPHAVHVVAVLRVLDGKEIGGDALVERPPGLSAIRALERSADRDADVEMPGVARIDVDRVQCRTAGRPLILLAADPDDAHGVGIEAGDAFPSDAAVIGAEQSRRRDACVPGAGLRRMPRREPEHMFHREAFLAGSSLRKRGRALGFLPRAAEVGRAEYGRPEMARANGAEQRLAVARVEHEMVDDVAEKMRPCERPAPARAVRLHEKHALAGSDEQGHRSRSGTRRPLRGFGFRHEHPLYVFSPSIQRP